MDFLLFLFMGDDTEIPDGAQILSERGLLDLDTEYKYVNKGQFERSEKDTWVESGKNPDFAGSAQWFRDCVISDTFFLNDRFPNTQYPNRGSRRVLRVNLNFES